MTDHKYSVPDDHWEEDDEQDVDVEPPLTVTRHTITIDDQRDAHGYEYGLEWTFNIEDGVVTGYYKGHWLEGRTQSDPMLSPAWEDVPTVIKARLATELNVDHAGAIETDLPEHYGDDVFGGDGGGA